MSKFLSSLFSTPSGWSATTHFCSWTPATSTAGATPLTDPTETYPTPFWLGIFLSLFLLNAVQSQSAVASIDLESKCLKVAVVNLKPGQAPISINEMSKWKTPSLVAFYSNSRLIGKESLGLLVRYPTKVYFHLPILLFKPFNYPQKFLRSLYLSYDITPDETQDVAVYKTEEGGGEFSKFTAEEMVAIILKYAMGLVENQARSSVKDVVITVPPLHGGG
ncbi:Heat shock 70 kDa protein 17 [Abeliophyllum distichum]|uniref:Heat shock 70 kDa protein 17 n=1 Tax=Abeliophyllum distichum TaxID=126358 RepID=A0ABD1PTG2_9LAMI